MILLLKAVIMSAFIQYGEVGLGPDEAQYWTWSQQLDWGYYSKPPGIAWQIALGTKLFGNTEFGVRFVTILFSFLLSLSVYFAAISSRLKESTAFWAAMAMAFSPLGILSSLFATTDIGMVLFWSLSSWIVIDALAKRISLNYYLLGLTIMCGALFKWPIYLFWGFAIGFALKYRFLFSRHLPLSIVLSLLGLLPSVIWNFQHEWGTFKHVAATVSGGSEGSHHLGLFNGNLLDFLGAQVALISPILFVLLIASFVHLLVHRRVLSPQLQFCGFIPLTILLFYSLLALFQKIQGNWCVFAYSTAFIFLSWYSCEQLPKGKLWIKLGIILSIVLTLFVLSIPTLQSHNVMSNYKIPYKISPFRHNVGWSNISTILSKAGYDPENEFLFGDKYQTTSVLSFYGPKQKRAYFFNLHEIRKNQFTFWPGMPEEQVGKNGYFVVMENSPHFERDLENHLTFYRQELPKYFKEVQFIGIEPVFESYDKPTKHALIFKGIEYNGKEPITPLRY